MTVELNVRNWQYRMLATVYHGSNFGHYLELEQSWRGRNNILRTGLGQWTGLGIPDDVLRTSQAIVASTWAEHLVNRYGVQDELPLRWSGEPDPF